MDEIKGTRKETVSEPFAIRILPRVAKAFPFTFPFAIPFQ
jgi:hypothetical protein